MKTLLLTLIAAFSFNANAGVPGSPVLNPGGRGRPVIPVADACRGNVLEVANDYYAGSTVVAITRQESDLPANLLTYKVDFAPVMDELEGEPVLPAGVPTIPTPKGKPFGLPGGVPGGIVIPPAPQTDSLIFIMEMDEQGLASCTFFGTIDL